MDEMDSRIIGLLRRDGRASLSELAAELKVQRGTIRARLDKLRENGEIAGFTVQTRADVSPHAVRGFIMLKATSKKAERAAKAMRYFPQVIAIHSTSGTWDLIAEIGTETLADFDKILTTIRRLEGITQSETNLLLSTQR